MHFCKVSTVSAALLGLAWQAKVGDSKTRKLSTVTLFDLGAMQGWLPEEGAAA